MTTSLKIPFAVNDAGRVVDVRDLPKNTLGQFHCAECKSPVTLKQGEVRTWHFAHKADTNCTASFETALHMLAKQVLLDERHIRTPALVCRLYERPSEHDITLCDERTVRWDTVGEVEKWLGSVRPDFMVTGADEPLIVEIAVTHFSDVEKRNKLQHLRTPALEIDLSGVARDITLAEVKLRVLDSLTDKKWIFYPGEAEARAQLKARRDEENARRGAALQREREEERRRDAAAKAKAKAEEEENKRKIARANERFRQSTNAEKLAFIAAKLGTPERAWPQSLDIQVRGALSIRAPLRVWQADVFRKFVHGQLALQSRPTVTVEFVAGWLSLRYAVLPSAANSVRVAVWDFLCSLESHGHLRRRFRQEFEVCNDLLIAPLAPAAVSRQDEPQSSRAVFWARDFGDEGQIHLAALRKGLSVPAWFIEQLLSARSSAKFSLTEEAYAHSVAATLNVSIDRAFEFLIAAGFFVPLDVTR